MEKLTQEELNYYTSALARLEGKNVQVSIGNIREQVKIQQQMHGLEYDQMVRKWIASDKLPKQPPKNDETGS